jgi:hypothetical protein
MRNLHPYLLVALSLLPLSSIAQTSLCTQGEVTEWSCKAKGKIYSLCSSKDLSPTTGYMQYRAGKSSETEFTFPEHLEHPKGYFRLGLAPRGAWLTFSNAGYEYFIYEPLIGPTLIDVVKSQSPVASVTCRSATDTLTLTTTQDRFRLLGIYQ